MQNAYFIRNSRWGTRSSRSNRRSCGRGGACSSPEIKVKLKPCGEIAKEQLQLIKTHFPGVTIEDYIIMPDHIHALIFLHGKTGGASPSPTLNDVICAFKSLTSRSCKQKYGIEKMFQRSFAEHIVRDREDYETRKTYIYENPERWYYKLHGRWGTCSFRSNRRSHGGGWYNLCVLTR